MSCEFQTARESVQVLEAKWHNDPHEETVFFHNIGTPQQPKFSRSCATRWRDSASTDAIQAFLEKLQSVDIGELKKLFDGPGVQRSSPSN